MILTFATSPAAAVSPQLLAVAVLVAYGIAASSVSPSARGPAIALTIGWVLHGAWLAIDIAGVGREPPGLRLGFGPVLSLAAWMILAVHAVESRFVPLPGVRRWLALFGAGTMLLAWMFPGELHPMSSRLAPLHWVLGVASYGLFGAAVLHATMLDSAERQMRLRATPSQGPLGMPLLRLERLTFRFVEAGFTVLTLALILGVATSTQWRLDHKTVFSLLGWGVFAALLAGRHWQGWRGQRATRWLYAGALLLLLGYVGSRFVFEVLLKRGTP
jgi:ABC-type uncharacterized transport system permease subunit